MRDHGPGFPPGQIAQLFEPFFTTRATGTGLGLAVARRMVQLHGGTIRGRERAGRRRLRAHRDPGGPGLTMARILVVDDEEGLREFLAEALEADGHVTVARRRRRRPRPTGWRARASTS